MSRGSQLCTMFEVPISLALHREHVFSSPLFVSCPLPRSSQQRRKKIKPRNLKKGWDGTQWEILVPPLSPDLNLGGHHSDWKPLVPWPVWLSWLGITLQRESLLVWFPLRAHAGLQARSPVGARMPETGNWLISHRCSLSPLLPLSLKINK